MSKMNAEERKLHHQMLRQRVVNAADGMKVQLHLASCWSGADPANQVRHMQQSIGYAKNLMEAVAALREWEAWDIPMDNAHAWNLNRDPSKEGK